MPKLNAGRLLQCAIICLAAGLWSKNVWAAVLAFGLFLAEYYDRR